MKLFEIIAASEFDKKGTPMKLPNMYTCKDIGKKMSVSAKTITIRSSGTGKVYGRRTIISK